MICRQPVVSLLQRDGMWSYHPLISQCWPIQSVYRPSHQHPNTTMAEEGWCREGLGGGVRPAPSRREVGCWWGCLHPSTSLGHLSGSGRTQHLWRLSWTIKRCFLSDKGGKFSFGKKAFVVTFFFFFLLLFVVVPIDMGKSICFLKRVLYILLVSTFWTHIFFACI